MIKLLLLRFKTQRALLPLFVLVALFMLLMGQTSADALSERQPSLSLAVQQKESDEYSEQLVEILAQSSNITLHELPAELSSEQVFSEVQVQGLVVISSDFGEALENGDKAKVLYYPAPGISDSSFGKEQVADAIMRLQARSSLEHALIALGEEDALEALNESHKDLLETVYDGPSATSRSAQGMPVYGVAALLLLLAWLHASLLVPGPDSKRTRQHGRAACVRELAASLLVVWIVWLVILALYLVLLTLSAGELPSLKRVCGFIALIFYASSMAALCVQVFGRVPTTWLFLLIFGLSMTIGGGLWGQVVVSPLLSPLVPVAVVVLEEGAAWLGIGVLAVLGVAALLVARYIIGKTNRVLQP